MDTEELWEGRKMKQKDLFTIAYSLYLSFGNKELKRKTVTELSKHILIQHHCELQPFRIPQQQGVLVNYIQNNGKLVGKIPDIIIRFFDIEELNKGHC